jgi:transposase-like protein
LPQADAPSRATPDEFRRRPYKTTPPGVNVTLDGYPPSHQALMLFRREDPKWKYVLVRSCQYLNNIIEQDHRAIKRRCAWMTGFKSDRTAAITLSGIELAHRIRKRQFSLVPAVNGGIGR